MSVSGSFISRRTFGAGLGAAMLSACGGGGEDYAQAAANTRRPPDWIAPPLFNMAFTVQAETRKYLEQMNTSPGVAVFTAAEATPAHWIEVGRAYQRFALKAALIGLKHAFANQPVEAPEIRSRFAAHLGLGGKRPDLIIRFGYAPDLHFSMRRPVGEALTT